MLGGTLNPFHIFQSKRTGASQFGLIFGGKCGQNYSDRLNLVWDDIVGVWSRANWVPWSILRRSFYGARLLLKQCFMIFMINTWLAKAYHDHHMVMIIMIVHHRNHHHHQHHQDQLSKPHNVTGHKIQNITILTSMAA